MSFVNKLFARSESVLLNAGHGETFVVLNGKYKGKSFIARLDVQEVLNLDGVTGSDTRMQSVIRIKQPAIVLEAQDKVRSLDKVWTILKREDNAATVTVDYWVEQHL